MPGLCLCQGRVAVPSCYQLVNNLSSFVCCPSCLPGDDKRQTVYSVNTASHTVQLGERAISPSTGHTAAAVSAGSWTASLSSFLLHLRGC